MVKKDDGILIVALLAAFIGMGGGVSQGDPLPTEPTAEAPPITTEPGDYYQAPYEPSIHIAEPYYPKEAPEIHTEVRYTPEPLITQLQEEPIFLPGGISITTVETPTEAPPMMLVEIPKIAPTRIWY